MNINTVQIDYVRLGSFDKQASYYWLSQLSHFARLEGLETERGRFMQYKGVKCEFGFAGIAQQGEKGSGRTHTLIHLSGERAARYANTLRALADGGGKATRIDLQVTIPLADNKWDILGWRDTLMGAEWGHRRPSITAIVGEAGEHTLYIGSRQSERFWRFYVKKDGSGEAYLRAEIEYKGDMAEKLWARDSTAYAGTLGAELRHLPLPNDAISQELLRVTNHGVGIGYTVHESTKTWEWLNEAVTPVVQKMLNSHEHVQAMRNLLESWLSGHVSDSVISS